MDNMTWGILALLLTGAGLAATWWFYTRRGTLAAATALGWTLMVPAAWLTGVLELATRIATAFSRWTSQLVFSPTFWIGVGLGGAGLLTLVVTTALRRRGRGGATQRPEPQGAIADAPRSAGRRPVAAPADDDLGDIEALLRKRGIE